jgi:hypothetical protein
MNDEEQIVAWIGVDWADEDHKVWKYNVGTGGKDNYAVPHSAESLQEWVRQLREFANCACRFCAWSKLYYQQQRTRGNDHHAAVRALAYKWIRIMFRCWKDRTPYDDSLYVKSLTKRGSLLANGLNLPRPDVVEI